MPLKIPKRLARVTISLHSHYLKDVNSHIITGLQVDISVSI